MNKKFLLLSFYILLGCGVNHTLTQDKRAKKVIFFGDSITRRGTEPNGYITRLRRILDSTGLSGDYKLVGSGVGGNTLDNLHARVDSSVIQQAPDAVIIFIGVNDMNHKKVPDLKQSLADFHDSYVSLIDKIKTGLNNKCKIVLCTIASVNEKKYIIQNNVYPQLDQYNNQIKKIGQELNIPVCDVRKSFMDYYHTHTVPDEPKGILTIDGIHPNDIGNNILADDLLPVLKKL